MRGFDAVYNDIIATKQDSANSNSGNTDSIDLDKLAEKVTQRMIEHMETEQNQETETETETETYQEQESEE